MMQKNLLTSDDECGFKDCTYPYLHKESCVGVAITHNNTKEMEIHWIKCGCYHRRRRRESWFIFRYNKFSPTTTTKPEPHTWDTKASCPYNEIAGKSRRGCARQELIISRDSVELKEHRMFTNNSQLSRVTIALLCVGGRERNGECTKALLLIRLLCCWHINL